MLQQSATALVENGRLDAGQLRDALHVLLRGEFHEAEAAAFLTALRMRGETAEDLAVAAGVLREHMIRLNTGDAPVLDTCGTGGDGANTFNISTLVALVVAACGVPVVKHGNRGASSICGSADLMAALGVRFDGGPEVAERCLRKVGLAFCFAPRFHPAMRHVAELRRRLGFRTIFNLIGPLANPARAPFQLIGVGRLDVLDRLATCLAELGGTTAHIVHGQDGLDEVTLGATTAVRLVANGQVRCLEWTPEMFGLPRRSVNELRISSVAESVALAQRILSGERGPAADVVLANAAAALFTVGRVATLPEGVAKARQALAAGLAQEKLRQLAAESQLESLSPAEK